LINNNKYWVVTNKQLEINNLYQIALTLKEDSYHLYVGKDTENIGMAANINTVIPSDIFNKNFQLGHHLHSNQAQGTYDELYVKKTAANQSTIDLWHASTSAMIDLNKSVSVDVNQNPIIAGAGAVVINTDGVFGYNNGTKRAGLGTDGKFMCGSGAIKGDENGLSIANGAVVANSNGITTYNGSTPQITIGSNGKLSFANGAVVADASGFRTYNGGVQQCGIGTDGRLIAGSGNVTVDSDGILITNGKLIIKNGNTVILDGTKRVLSLWCDPISVSIPGRTSGSQPGVGIAQWIDPGYKPMFLVYTYYTFGHTYTEMWGFNDNYYVNAYPFLLNNYSLQIHNYNMTSAICTVYIITQIVT
jgi:hypothetical protein